MRSSVLARLALPLLVAAPAAVLAHPGHDHAVSGLGHSLAAGLMHPLTGLDHICAMVVLGVWSAMTTRRIWLAPLTFALVLLAGALLGLSGVHLPAVEPMIAVSLLALGLLTATRAHLPEGVGAALAGGFALFHGVAHGAELPHGAVAAAYVAGFMTATVLLHCTGIAGGLALRRFERRADASHSAESAGVTQPARSGGAVTMARAWPARLLGGGVALYGIALLAG